MNKKIMIQDVRLVPDATAEDFAALRENMVKYNIDEMYLVPDPKDASMYIGMVNAKYYTSDLSDTVRVRDTKKDGQLYLLSIPNVAARSYENHIMRKLRAQNGQSKETSSPLIDIFPADPDLTLPRQDLARCFLSSTTPAQIERALNERVISQPELTKAVANFLYYHALRQVHPELPQRPLLISGPSGSGKTEVWRAVSSLYGDTFPIKVIDGSSISCDGWAGNFKVSTFVDRTLTDGGILVVDEFDKLVKPKHSASGDNVSLDVQAEFLKLIEGEYQVTEKKKATGLTSKQMGFAMIGAFESLRAKIEKRQAEPARTIGFCSQEQDQSAPSAVTLTDEDFIAYGIMPEFVGRIATKCATAPLCEAAYMRIIRGPHSRVTKLEEILRRYGANVSGVISDQELRAMIAASKHNKTGVRWVSAQIENRLLETIRENGLPIQTPVKEEDPFGLKAAVGDSFFF